MITWVLGLWGGIPPAARRAVMYAGIGVAALWGLKVFWLNPHDSKVEQEGRLRVVKEMEQEYQQKWEEAKKKLDSDRQSLDSQLAAVAEQQKLNDAKMKEIAQARAALQALSSRIETQYQATTEINHATASSVSGAGLDDAIRAISRQLPQPAAGAPH